MTEGSDSTPAPSEDAYADLSPAQDAANENMAAQIAAYEAAQADAAAESTWSLLDSFRSDYSSDES